jgi:hypothetical protein
MMENMIGEVARAMQDDRRRQETSNERIAEALSPYGSKLHGSRMRARRAAIARALIALAARLEPPTLQEAPRPTIVTQ